MDWTNYINGGFGDAISDTYKGYGKVWNFMKKLLELLFFQELKGVGKVRINQKYIPFLEENQGIDVCVDFAKKNETKLDIQEIMAAKEIAEQKYNEIMDTADIEIITCFDENYPQRLLYLKEKRPVILYAKGKTNILNDMSIAIVGTRKPSVQSRTNEEKLVKKILSIKDYVIVSGLAVGCDTIAHQTAVNEKAKTVAVLPSGVNVIYPATNKKLAQDILDNGGCIISEYEPEEQPSKGSYIERDKVIAALANATIAIEFGIKSGTMHTVERAYELKRSLACYNSEDITKDTFAGNLKMINEKKAMPISNTQEQELEKFLRAIERNGITEVKEQTKLF